MSKIENEAERMIDFCSETRKLNLKNCKIVQGHWYEHGRQHELDSNIAYQLIWKAANSKDIVAMAKLCKVLTTRFLIEFLFQKLKDFESLNCVKIYGDFMNKY